MRMLIPVLTLKPKIASKSPLCILGSWVLGFERNKGNKDPYSTYSRFYLQTQDCSQKSSVHLGFLGSWV